MPGEGRVAVTGQGTVRTADTSGDLAGGGLVWKYSMLPGYSLSTVDGAVELTTPGNPLPLGKLDPAVAAALSRFCKEPTDPREVEDDLAAGDDPIAAATRIARWRRLVGGLRPALCRHAFLDGAELMRVTPMTGSIADVPADLPGGTRIRLSRASVVHAVAGETVLESALSTMRIVVTDPRLLLLLGVLAQAGPVDRLDSGACGLPAEAAHEVTGWLVSFRMVARERPGGGFDEDEGTLGQWSANDLMVHARSRFGWHSYPYGATFRLLGQVEPEPAVRPAHPGQPISLYRPEQMAICPDEPSFTEILEARQSIRSYGPQGLSLRQLGEFLFRSTRTRFWYGPFPERSMPYEAADRPYPSGGGTADLEVYVTAHRVSGLPRATYHYDSWRHVLVPVCEQPDLVEGMLSAAVLSKGADTPDALLTVTSRFARLAWKYEQIAYATTLRNVGVLYQTFYLVATAMGLAPCGLGGGNSALVAHVIGVDPFVEGSVGDFALGTLPSPELLAEQRKAAEPGDRWHAGQAPEWCQVRRRVVFPRTT